MTSNRWFRLTVVGVVVALLGAGVARMRATGPNISLNFFGTSFNSPIGIDFFEPTVGSGELISSANYPSGLPFNFQLIDAAANRTQFTTLSGLQNELKIATIRAGACTGGFPVGTAFAGNGVPGQVLKINPDATFQNPWVILPGENIHIRGSLYQDRACAAGGDLIVVTGNEQNGDPTNDNAGRVWRVNSAGVPTLLADIGRHLEGVITLPGDAAGIAKYGPLAGMIIVGDESLDPNTRSSYPPGTGRIWVVSPQPGVGVVATVGVAFNGSIPNYPTDVPLHPEDLDLIPQPRAGLPAPEGDLFAIDFGNSQILHATASDFADKCGQILVTQEFPNADVLSGLSTLQWNGAQGKFIVTPLTNVGNSAVGHFEHVTFWGGTECQPPHIKIVKLTNGVDANDPSAAGVPLITPGQPVTWTYAVTNDGTVDIPEADITVVDNVVGPITQIVNKGNGDAVLSPGETWIYQKTGTALDLSTAVGPNVVPNKCQEGNAGNPGRNAYVNLGTVTIPSMSASDPDSYCNPPPVPGVTIIKYTNGQDANDPNGGDVPNVSPGGTVTWTYKVTNTGQTSIPRAQVVVTDNTTGVTPAFSSELLGDGDTIFEPNEVWLYTATGTALNLTLPPPAGVHTVANSCTANGTQPPRTAYTNVGTVTIPGANASDPSSYCNPPQSSKGISIGPSSMEGAIKISAGDWVNGGYSFKTNFTGNITISATVSITGKCIGGSLPSDTLTVNLGSIAYSAVAGSDWKPTGDANSILSWQGSIVAPATMCGGGQLDGSKGAVFNATISGAPAGGLVTFRFKYRDPAAKTKPNTNCLDANDPNRNKADVCGASWSATKTDP